MSRFLTCLILLGLTAWLGGSLVCQAAAAQAQCQEAALASQPNWTYDDRTQIGAQMGAAVAAVGDVNGDGYEDVLVGADKYSLSVEVEGAALLFYGGAAGLAENPTWSAGGGLKGARFGGSVSPAGDINGDNFADVLVGASRFNHEHPEEGAVFAFYGSASGLGAAAGWQFESNQKNALLGASVSSAGDVNGDGFADVIAGAPLYEEVITQTNRGAVFGFYGSAAGLSPAPDWMVLGIVDNAQLGAAVAGAGDVNCDGYADVIAGAPQAAGRGMAAVYYGSNTGLQTDPAWSAVFDQDEAQFGAAVAGVGDVNGDGCGDVLVGAPYANNGLTEKVGGAFLFLGSPAGLGLVPAWQGYGNQAYGLYGAAVAGAGDVNRDGRADVLVGAPRLTLNHANEGALFIYLGKPDGLQASFTWRANGDKAEAFLGSALHGGGDVNQDGWVDVLGGAPGYKVDSIIVGRSMAYYGTSTTNTRRVFIPVVIRQP